MSPIACVCVCVCLLSLSLARTHTHTHIRASVPLPSPLCITLYRCEMLFIRLVHRSHPPAPPQFLLLLLPLLCAPHSPSMRRQYQPPPLPCLFLLPPLPPALVSLLHVYTIPLYAIKSISTTTTQLMKTPETGHASIHKKTRITTRPHTSCVFFAIHS